MYRLIAVFIALAGLASAEPAIVLEDGARVVRIDPPTLAAVATQPDGSSVTLSRPALETDSVGDLRVNSSEARWRLVRRKIDVTASLSQEGFRIGLRAAESGSITWPVLGEERGLEAYALP